jgi:hypothetical protein
VLTETFTFTAPVRVFTGKAAWYFVNLPVELAQAIDFKFSPFKRGWGSLRVTVSIGTTTWETSIFPDKEVNSYMLPLKAEVRKKEHISRGDAVSVILVVRD